MNSMTILQLQPHKQLSTRTGALFSVLWFFLSLNSAWLGFVSKFHVLCSHIFTEILKSFVIADLLPVYHVPLRSSVPI